MNGNIEEIGDFGLGETEASPSQAVAAREAAHEAQWEEEREAALQESREMNMGETEASPLQAVAAREGGVQGGGAVGESRVGEVRPRVHVGLNGA